MNKKQLWQATLGELELVLSKANFITWFKNTFITAYDGGRLTVAVPNTFTKAWLEKKYHMVIIRALQKITNNEVREVVYKVETQKPEFSENTMPRQDGDAGVATVEASSATATDTATVIEQDGLNPRFNFSAFVVGKSNELACAACQSIAERPGGSYNPLFLYGGVGLGKTHLMQAIGNALKTQSPKRKILYVTCEKFTNDFIQSVKTNPNKFKDLYRSVDVLLIDDIQFLAGKDGTQEAFFYTFNELHQNNKQIVMSSDRPPKAIPGLENRLVSRFEMGMMADVNIPDLETRIAILETKCQERNFNLSNEVINFLASNIQNNIRELEGALNKLMAHQQLYKKKIDKESAKTILASLTAAPAKKTVTPKQIINTVSDFYDIEIDDLLGDCRKKNLAVPRQIVMFLMREEINTSYPSIGQFVGNRDHTTAMHAYSKISKAVNEDEKIKQDITFIRERLYS